MFSQVIYFNKILIHHFDIYSNKKLKNIYLTFYFDFIFIVK